MKASIPNAKILCSILLTMIWGITAMAQEENKSATPHWKIHDMSRPKSPLAHPLEQSLPAPHPDNAIVLFEGSDFSHWTGSDNKDPRWKIENGYMEIVPG